MRDLFKRKGCGNSIPPQQKNKKKKSRYYAEEEQTVAAAANISGEGACVERSSGVAFGSRKDNLHLRSLWPLAYGLH